MFLDFKKMVMPAYRAKDHSRDQVIFYSVPHKTTIIGISLGEIDKFETRDIAKKQSQCS